MPIYTLLARVYLGDEELFELLSRKNVGRRELLRLMRGRGMLFGEKSEHDDIRSAMALIPSDWKLVSGVLESIARPDREERDTSVHITNCDEKKNDIGDLISKVQEARGVAFTERYNPTRIDDKTYKVEVTYTDIDTSLAVPYQRQERKLNIEVTKEGDKISIRHSANDRGMQIVNDFRALLEFKANLSPEVIRISLQGIRDASLRTRFFTELIKSVPGYRFLNATQINVDRRFPVEEPEDSSDDESSEPPPETAKKKVEAKIKSFVNQVALRGDEVLGDTLYQTVEQSGYYISNIHWSCEYQKDIRHGIDCVAGFRDPVAADEFTFDVVRSWRFKSEAPDEEETLRPTEEERRTLKKLIEKASFTAFEKVQKLAQTTKAAAKK